MGEHISKIKGMVPEFQAKLEAEGIHHTDHLLEHTKNEKQRSDLAKKVGATPHVIKEYANRSDLMRLKGVGGDFSNLLEEAGVNSCKELQHRSADNLHTKLVEIHTSQKVGHHVPTLAQVTEWITEAKALAHTSVE